MEQKAFESKKPQVGRRTRKTTLQSHLTGAGKVCSPVLVFKTKDNKKISAPAKVLM